MLLRFNHDTLQFLKNRKLLVRRVNLGIALLVAGKKSDFLQALEFALDVARIFFDEFREAADMSVEVWILGVYDHNLSAHSRGNKNV